MHDPEYREQRIETAAQWSSGLLCRAAQDAAGLSLFARPAFDEWVNLGASTSPPVDLVVDECDQIYWVARVSKGWSLFRYDPRTGYAERVISLGGATEIEPRRLWLTPAVLWVLDARGGRVVGLARQTFQVLYDVAVGLTLVDAAFDGRAVFFTLHRDAGTPQVCRHPVPPAPATSECVPLGGCGRPVALAVAAGGDVFVYCADRHRLLRIRAADARQELVGSREIDALKGAAAAGLTSMAIDGRGVIYLATHEAAGAVLHQFDSSGSYLGRVPLPREIRDIRGLAFDRANSLYLATDRGVARFSLTLAAVGEAGVYYTRTLDSGAAGGPWHRLALAADLPPRTSIAVEHAASDDAALKRAVDAVFASDLPVHERCERLERLLGSHWKARGAETFGSDAQAASGGGGELAMLVGSNRGRYLWIKLTLSTFDERNRPSVRSLRVLYPRLSYLRYLPATYREDPVHSAFLERFLAIFETVFHDLDRTIDLLYRHFDAQLAAPEFLPWLASWIGLTVEDDVPDARVRRLIERSPVLFRTRGTAAALAEFLRIYTGHRVFVVEDALRLEPLVLGAGSVLGQQVILLGAERRGLRVGDSSHIGLVALRDRVRDKGEPFLAMAGRFTVLFDMPRAEFAVRRRTLERLVDEQKPAHATCALRLVSDYNFAGAAVLGTGAGVTERQPYQIGVTPLGDGLAGGHLNGLHLERGAAVSGSAGLV